MEVPTTDRGGFIYDHPHQRSGVFVICEVVFINNPITHTLGKHLLHVREELILGVWGVIGRNNASIAMVPPINPLDFGEGKGRN